MNQPLVVESPYPVDALPEPLKSAAIAAAHLAGVPEGMAAISLIVSLATATQSEYNVEALGEDVKPLSLFVIVTAESGVRKSTVGKSAMRTHLEADNVLERRWREARREYDEADKDDKPRRPTSRRPLAVRMDATMETIPNSMSLGRPSFTQLLSEAATFTGKWSGVKGQQLGTMQNMNTIWDGEAHVIDRMNDGGRSCISQMAAFLFCGTGNRTSFSPGPSQKPDRTVSPRGSCFTLIMRSRLRLRT